MNQEEHDLLIRIDERLGVVEKNLTNHLKSHNKLAWALLTTTFSSITALVISLLYH